MAIEGIDYTFKLLRCVTEDDSSDKHFKLCLQVAEDKELV